MNKIEHTTKSVCISIITVIYKILRGEIKVHNNCQ